MEKCTKEVFDEKTFGIFAARKIKCKGENPDKFATHSRCVFATAVTIISWMKKKVVRTRGP